MSTINTNTTQRFSESNTIESDTTTSPEISPVEPEIDAITDTTLPSELPAELPETSGLSLEQFQSLIEAGGPVIMVLMAMSLIALTVFLCKYWQFSWSGINRHKIIHNALKSWHERKPHQAQKVLKGSRHPIAPVLTTAIELQSNNVDSAVAREEVMRLAKRQLASARSHLKTLEVIATLSPLIGLLGTVLGMISAFQNLQGAGSTIDPALLSGGIWEALLTTAAGLIVAIPTVVGLNWLEQKIEKFKLVLEDSMTQIFTIDAYPYEKSKSRIDNSHASATQAPQHQVSDSALTLAN